MISSRRKEVALVASGIILGAAIAAPVAGAALTAQQSGQKITVDGKPVQIEAYSFNGNNYAKLRDVGKAVGFAVEYDAATNTVQISTKTEYKEDNVSNGLRTVVLPTDGSQYIPQVGDLIPCDDGTTYEVKDVVRWDSNVFAEGPLPPLPTPTCKWNAFPALELPEPIVKHYHDKHGDALFVRNVYEVRRMVYTIYNAIGEEPEAWRDGRPLCKIFTEIPLEYEPYTGVFWPWRESEETRHMAKRRGNGEGSIRKRKDGRREGRYVAGHDANGKPIRKNVLGKTQAEVKEKLKRAIADAEKLDFSKTGQYTVGQWMDVWFENYAKVKVRPSSHQTYQGYIAHHIKPRIGGIPLDKLTTLDLQRLYKTLLTSGRVDRLESRKQPKGLTAKTVRNINQIISSALDQAIAQKLILTNPTKGCALPKIEHREMKTLSSDQLSAFLREAKESGVYELYYFELATGLRRGELVGLKWEDVDWHRHTIRIRRQVARVNGVISEVQLKTKNVYRTISLGEGAMRVLETQEKKSDSEYIFPLPSGGPMAPDSMLKMLHRVLQRAGLPMLRMHDLRHTFATLALQNGVDIKTVSSMLGHFSAGFTLDTYTRHDARADRGGEDDRQRVGGGDVRGGVPCCRTNLFVKFLRKSEKILRRGIKGRLPLCLGARAD